MGSRYDLYNWYHRIYTMQTKKAPKLDTSQVEDIWEGTHPSGTPLPHL